MIFLLLGIFFQSSAVFACECTIRPTVLEAYQQSPRIFTARIEDRSFKENKFHYRIKLIRSWKGESGKAFDLTVNSGKGCGYNLEIGKTYLIYTDTGGEDSVSICGRTAILSGAQADISALDSIIKGKER